MLAVLVLLGVLGGHALVRACRRAPGASAPPARTAAGGDSSTYPRDADVFVLPEGRWGRVVCSACGPGGCWVGVRLRSGRTWAGPDFELTR